jgi:hypothetical protein
VQTFEVGSILIILKVVKKGC